MEIQKEYLKLSLPLIKMALHEDIQDRDVTTDTIVPITKQCSAKIVAKGDGIISGLSVVKTIFELLEGKYIQWQPNVTDGDNIREGQIIVEVGASYRTILSGERTALNFLQRMSGIASKTKKFVQQLEGTGTKLLDTRKTAPGLRYLDKYSVLVGGGQNHRFGLYDMVMLKENHIKTAGSITKAVEQIREKFKNKYKIEVETTNINEVKEAVDSGVDIIMLDNMSLQRMKECVSYIDGQVVTEASGNINLNNIRETALTGVNFISVGELTHSVNALDISLLIK